MDVCPTARPGLRRDSRVPLGGVFYGDGTPCESLALAPGSCPTSTGGQRAAPLAAAAALGLGRALQHVAGAAGEVHHVVQVEGAAVGAPVGGVAGVTAGDGCGGGQARVIVSKQAGPPVAWSSSVTSSKCVMAGFQGSQPTRHCGYKELLRKHHGLSPQDFVQIVENAPPKCTSLSS